MYIVLSLYNRKKEYVILEAADPPISLYSKTEFLFIHQKADISKIQMPGE
jgi:hypothetical protein